jgi:hypothetical protein
LELVMEVEPEETRGRTPMRGTTRRRTPPPKRRTKKNSRMPESSSVED